jgi:hypothetical protein
MVVWFSNVPDQEHVPYKQICVEPPIRDVYRYLRTSDYLQWLGFGAGIPFGIYLLGTIPSFDSIERYRPTLHPKTLNRSMYIMVPAMTLAGMVIVGQKSLGKIFKINHEFDSGECQKISENGKCGNQKEKRELCQFVEHFE